MTQQPTPATPVQHDIRTYEGRLGHFQSVCSCGQYRSRWYFYSGLAQSAAGDHRRAKASLR